MKNEGDFRAVYRAVDIIVSINCNYSRRRAVMMSLLYEYSMNYITHK